MGTLHTTRVSSLLAALSLFAVACGGDDDHHKDGGIVITVPDGGTQPHIDGGVPSIDSGLTDASTGDGGGQTTPPNKSCTPVNGCVCNPTTSVEFLNACTTGTCQPFDNAARIPGFTGTLPALP